VAVDLAQSGVLARAPGTRPGAADNAHDFFLMTARCGLLDATRTTRSDGWLSRENLVASGTDEIHFSPRSQHAPITDRTFLVPVSRWTFGRREGGSLTEGVLPPRSWTFGRRTSPSANFIQVFPSSSSPESESPFFTQSLPKSGRLDGTAGVPLGLPGG
jgi:hypothetical protein